MNYSTSDYLEQLQQDREDLVDNLEAKGITGLTGDETFTELVPEVLNIPSGGSTEAPEKDVNFYDYDGTRVYSYTKTEFLALESMPANPTHDGLISDGWNWTLSDAKDYVTNYEFLEIGQLYDTDDDKTRMYLELEGKSLSPTLTLRMNGTATVEWGDGTSDTMTGTNEKVSVQHTYSQVGNYVIKISGNKTYQLYGYGTSIINSPYQNMVKKIECSSLMNGFGDHFVSYMYGLETITLPKNIDAYTTGRPAFTDCSSLKYIVMMDGVQCYGYFAKNCISLKGVSFPKTNPSFGGPGQGAFTNSAVKNICMPTQIDVSNAGEMFKECRMLKKIVLTRLVSAFLQSCPQLNKVKVASSITTIPQNAFNGEYSLFYVDFSNHTAVPTLSNTNAFTGIPSSCKIIVPDDLYEDWIAANNWSTISSKIIKKSDWDNL